MENKNMNWDVESELKEVSFYEAPKEGCPKFIIRYTKCDNSSIACFS